MRTDSGLAPTLRDAEAWKSAVDRRGILQQSDKSILSKSFSGHERNHLFYNVGGTSFQELSGISGLDTPADSRSWAWLDYDHDGWLDVALVNANRPLLNLFRNQIGQLGSSSQFVALRLFGGNRQAQASDYSCRDGYGAVIVAAIGKQSIMREHRCGEGFAAQNSPTMLLGIGEASQIDRLDVRWPSGRKQTFHSLPAGKRVSIYENPAQSPDGSGLVTELYVPASQSPTAAVGPPHAATLTAIPEIADQPAASLRLYTTMATWCPACKTHLPQFADLRDRFGDERLAVFGLPIDPKDSIEKLKTYQQHYQPAYELLLQTDEAARQEMQSVLVEALNSAPLPSSVVTDAEGRVLAVMPGVPSASDLAKIAERQDAERP